MSGRRAGLFLLLGVCAVALAATAPKASKSAPVAHAPAVALEDALGTFFDDIDKQSTTLRVMDEESPAPTPPFTNRDELHARVAARLAGVDRLRSRLRAGETARGFLEARGALPNTEEAVIAEENADRLAIYEAIAAQTRTKVDEVGRTRARQIAFRCQRGVWVQSPQGDWGQKT